MCVCVCVFVCVCVRVWGEGLSTCRADLLAASLIVSFNSKRHLRILGGNAQDEDGASQFFVLGFFSVLERWVGKPPVRVVRRT